MSREASFWNRILILAVMLSPLGASKVISEETVEPLLENMVVTSTREGQLKSEVAESISVVSSEDIQAVSPSHPAEILNRMPGVHINNLGGEGHMTSIRQPVTTAGVYLFLEDGVPTRPTGYFNHNGLYEVNIPQSSRIEVTKGPGSSLYGSDAIGGIINSLTQASPEQTELNVNAEVGEHNWQRVLISGGAALNEDTGFRADLNVTDNEGFRDNSDYSRWSTTLRLDSGLGENWKTKTVFSYSEIEQSGVSSLEEEEYIEDATLNFYAGDIGARNVEAMRLHTEFSREIGEDKLFTATPYFRYNNMEMTPSWMVTYDPNSRDYEFQSYGTMLKLRDAFADDQGMWILGMDVDYTPSTYLELEIDDPEDIAANAVDGQLSASDDGIYETYAETGVVNYDFDTDQTSISPYVHGEWRFDERWLMTAGLRYDYFTVDYTNNLEGETDGVSDHLREESQTVSYDQLSPKWSLIYQFNDHHNTYVNYRHGFRAPTIGNLFRSGSSENTAELDPVKVKSVELGFRGLISDGIEYELAIYDMQKTDDIVSVIDGDTRNTVNAGETVHRGVELGVKADITSELSAHFSWTKTDQSYEDFSYIYGYFDTTIFSYVTEERNYAGNDIGKAPEQLGNISLTYAPNALEGLSLELEYDKVGSYFTDETNTLDYEGHELFNLRVNYQINERAAVYGRMMNLTDELYSTYTSAQVGDPDSSYRPGTPRSAYVGVRYQF